MEESTGITLDDITLGWIADPARVNYSGVRAISLPITPDIVPFSLYHALLNAFFLPYRSGYMDKMAVTAEHLVKQFASDLATGLDAPATGEKTVYSLLNGGQLATVSSYVERYSLEGLRNELVSPTVACGGAKPDPVVIEVVARTLHMGVLVLNEAKKDVYALGCEHLMKEYTSFIVLLYHRPTETEGYFTLVMLSPSDDEDVDLEEIEESTQAYFTASHPFIRALFTRIDAINAGSKQRARRR